MRIDLFELIEGFFSGVIYFLYNAVSTTAQLVHHPLKGPLRLYLRYRNHRYRQIGGLTFLFILFFALMLTLELVGLSDSALSEASKAAVLFGAFDGRIFWPVTVSALIATTITDATLRVFLKIRLRARPRRATIILGTVELAFLFPLVGFCGLAYCLPIILIAYDTIGADLSSSDSPAVVGALVVSVGLIIFAPIPPLALLRSGLRRTRRPGERGLLLKWGSAAGGIVAIWLLVSVAFIAAVIPATGRNRERSMTRHVEARRDRIIEVLELHCYPGGAQPYADALLRNIASRPILLPARDVRLRIFRWEKDRPQVRELSVRDDGSPPLVIQVGTGTFTRFRLQPNSEYTAAKDDSCSLSAPARDGRGQLFARTIKTVNFEGISDGP